LVAGRSLKVGQTLLSNSLSAPVTLIPFAVFIHKEHVSLRALVGTVVAFSGIVLLIL